MQVEARSPAETEAIAAELAGQLEPGDVVTVSGELGAGKTTFVRGAARALGVTAPVRSPTYTIGNRYTGSVDVSHLDLYRFERVSPPEWGDLEPYFDEAVVLRTHGGLLREAFDAHGGQVVDTQGDAFFAVFGRAKEAVEAAVAAQRALAGYEWPGGGEVRVRMGLHTGEPAVGEGRYVGLGVH